MRKKSVFSIFMLAVLLLATSFVRVGRVEDFLSKPSSPSVPELVASQIMSSSLSCPTSGSLTYETCLLYQGALGIWQAIGLPHACPAVVDHPTPLPKAAKLTADDVLHAPTVPCFSYIYAAQVANLVPTLISTPARAFLLLNGNFAEPGSNPELCIEARHGICGNQAAVAIALFKKAGFHARPVEFYYKSNTGERADHIIVEVMIDGAWRLVDTTYGAYWIDGTPAAPFALRTLEQVLDRSDPRTKIIRNPGLVPYGLYEEITRADFFDYLTSDADVLRGGEGEIRLLLHGNEGTEAFNHIPNFVGDNVEDEDSKGVSYRLQGDSGPYHVTINVAVSAAIGDEVMYLCLDAGCQKVSTDRKKYEFDTIDPTTIHLKSTADVAYVVLKSIEWKSEQQ
jgi:hypothetical protein